MANGGSSDTNGLMQRISDVSWNAVKSDGVVANAVAAATTHVKDLQTQIDTKTLALTKRTAAMKAQFTAMETSLSRLKAMQTQLANQLGSLG
jgi:flagellar capping protein FliD